MPKDVDLERAAAAMEQFLSALGHDVGSDPELAHTGRRVAEAFHNELLSGYRSDPAKILSQTCASQSRGLVVVSGLATTAICPHHLLPAHGEATVGYLPSTKIVGVGAIDQLVQCFARRLILQEDLGQAIANALVEHVGAKAAGCRLNLAQSCMVARGARQTSSRMVTLAFAGDADAEFRRAFHDRLT